MREVHVRQRKLKSGIRYEYYFEIASVNGKRKYASKGGYKSKTEAKETGKIAQAEYERCGRVNKSSDMSYSDFLDIWISSLDDLKPITIANYEKKIRLYVKPTLGHYD